MTPEQFVTLLGFACGEYGGVDELPDYNATWWFDDKCRPAEVAKRFTDFFEQEQKKRQLP